MPRRLTATHRVCRRLGAPACGRPNCPALRRPYPPGVHGRRRRRLSEYHVRLLEKQKVRAIYGVGERQLRRYVEQARGGAGEFGENILLLLERRVDNMLRRLGFATTVRQARQLVSHGHVLVNGHRVDRPSYPVRSGDEIEIVRKDLVQVREAVAQSPDIPVYLHRDPEDLRGRLERLPNRDEIPYPIDVEERLLVEYYAR